MVRQLRRRSFIQGVIITLAGVITGLSLRRSRASQSTDSKTTAAKTIRKSARSMTNEEIERFKGAFEYAVSKGFFDIFNDEHHNHERNRNHGREMLATSPITININPNTWGYRLLPWHRSFLLEAEMMLRAALRKRNVDEGKNPYEADLLFIPYWDAAHDQDLPQWVLDFQPKGGTAIVPPNLPKGHAGYGKEVGERYDIQFGRWPGQNLVFDTLQTPDHVSRILSNTEFPKFYNALDGVPEVLEQNSPKSQAALKVLKKKLPDDPAVKKLVDNCSEPSVSEACRQPSNVDLTNAFLEIGWRAAVEARKTMPDIVIISAVKDVYSIYNFPPHLRMHLWAGGLDPKNADIRGTVTYFNELTVDPVFWMLHCELDRYWYTWEKTNKDKPPLEGDDAIFNPLTASEGSWYGGGKTYTLDELTTHDALPYIYNEDFRA